MIYAKPIYQFDPQDKIASESLQLLRFYIATLCGIRNSLEPGEGVSKFPKGELAEMLKDLKNIRNKLKSLDPSEDIQPFLSLKEMVIRKAIPDATVHLDVGMHERAEYEKHVRALDEDKQELARLKLTNCVKSCNKCSQALDDVLSHPDHINFMRKLRLDKYGIQL